MTEFLKYNFLWIVWAIALFFLSLSPVKELPARHLLEFDKILHLGAYFLLSLLMLFGWSRQQTFPSLHSLILTKIFLTSASYGFLLEYLQEMLTADRTFDWFDFIANVIGCAGIFIIGYLYPIHKQFISK